MITDRRFWTGFLVVLALLFYVLLFAPLVAPFV